MKLKITFSIVLFSLFSHAQSASSAGQQEAVQKTQALLKDPGQRAAALDTQQARLADQNVSITSLGNQNVKNDIYGVSSELIPWLADLQQGDSLGMQKLLHDAQSSPEALAQFYQRMPAAQREKIKAISQQIEGIRNSGGASSPLPVNP